MKAADLRSKSTAELQVELDKQLKDQFKQKMQLKYWTVVADAFAQDGQDAVLRKSKRC
jgi:hypothetical protein